MMKFSLFVEHNKKTLRLMGIALLLSFTSELLKLVIENGRLTIIPAFISIIYLIVVAVAEYTFSKNYSNNGSGAFIWTGLAVGAIYLVVTSSIIFLISIALMHWIDTTWINTVISTLTSTLFSWIFLALITSTEPLEVRIRYGFKTLKKNYWRLLIAAAVYFFLVNILPYLLNGIIISSNYQSLVQGILSSIGFVGFTLYTFYLFFTRGREPRFREIGLELKEEAIAINKKSH